MRHSSDVYLVDVASLRQLDRLDSYVRVAVIERLEGSIECGTLRSLARVIKELHSDWSGCATGCCKRSDATG